MLGQIQVFFPVLSSMNFCSRIFFLDLTFDLSLRRFPSSNSRWPFFFSKEHAWRQLIQWKVSAMSVILALWYKYNMYKIMAPPKNILKNKNKKRVDNREISLFGTYFVFCPTQRTRTTTKNKCLSACLVHFQCFCCQDRRDYYDITIFFLPWNFFFVKGRCPLKKKKLNFFLSRIAERVCSYFCSIRPSKNHSTRWILGTSCGHMWPTVTSCRSESMTEWIDLPSPKVIHHLSAFYCAGQVDRMLTCGSVCQIPKWSTYPRSTVPHK